MKHVKGAQAPFSVPDACALAIPTLRDDFLLNQALSAFEQGKLADALVYAEIVCRRHPNKAVPAMLRARIVQVARPEFSGNAWYQAYCRDPEHPESQDQLLRTWCVHNPAQAIRLGLQLLPGRCEAGTHQSLQNILRSLNVDAMAACWRDGEQIHGMLWGGANNTSSSANIYVSDGSQEWAYTVPADGSEFAIDPIGASSALSVYSISHVDEKGDRAAIPGSPLAFACTSKKTLATQPRAKPKKPSKLKQAQQAQPASICIIIPIYKGYLSAQACIQSVLASFAHNPIGVHLLLVDDASPEPELRNYLQQLAKADEITVLRNEINLGYLETINRAVAWQQAHLPQHDVLL